MLPIPALTIVASPGHQMGHAAMLAEGVARHGVKASVATEARARTKHAACWGWHVGKRLRRRGMEVLVMERGYVGDRFHWTSLGWNGLNGRARFAPKDDAARFEAHFAGLLKPWKTGGDYVMLIGQVPGDASLGGMDLSVWYDRSAKVAARSYGLPVRFRAHPVAIKRGERQKVRNAKPIDGTLAECLAGAAVVLTFNSNTAVESVLAGVPTVTIDQGSMAWEVSGHSIGDRLTPAREAWAARLAWCQWTPDEIRSGAAWEQVRP